MEIIQENKKNIKKIIAALKNGAVLVLPTDTVYGLVCDATSKKAVEKIFEIKKRNKSKPLPVFVKDIKMAQKYTVISARQKEFLNEKWPGAATFVMRAKKGLSPLVYKKGTIAMRHPDYKLIIEILKLLKRPLAQTSANISGSPATTKVKEVLELFNGRNIQPDFVVDAGDLPKNKPSIIIDITSNKIKILRK